MLTNSPKIYICCEEGFEEDLAETISYLQEKVKSYHTIHIDVSKEFTTLVPLLSEAVAEYNNNLGIIISSYGVYSSMMANRNRDIRAIVAYDLNPVVFGINNYNINLICIPILSLTSIKKEIRKIVDTFTSVERNYKYTVRNYMLEKI